MSEKRFHIRVNGRVQGVGFRHFTRQTATGLGLTGWVRNRGDGSVEMEVEGEPKALDTFQRRIHEGPALSFVRDFKVREVAVKGTETGFEVTF